jgi:DNA mismatch repair protein MutS
MSLIRSYLDLTKKYSNEYGDLSIVLMQNGAFFEVYGLRDQNNTIYGCKLDDFSRICELNIVEKNVNIDGVQVVNAGFKTHLVDKYIKKMQQQGYTIIIYEEDGDDPIKNTKIRNQTGIYSPGTYFHQENETDQITNNICCLWFETKKGTKFRTNTNYIYIGIGLIDIYTGSTYINEYNEEYIKNPTTFDELERFISIYNPSETIIISNLQPDEINDIVSYINLKSRAIHLVSLLDKTNNKNIQRANNCEKQTYQTELLNKFYKVNDINTFMGIFYDNVYATQAFCFLLDFVYQHNPYLIQKLSQPAFENTSNKLTLANHSLKQLNIIDDDNYKGKYSSVVKMLNECITSMGKRKFSNIFLNPVTNITYLQTEYDIIEQLLQDNNFEQYKIIKTFLTSIKDISKIMRQIIIQKVSPKMLYQLYTSINCAKNIYEFITNKKYLNNYFTAKIETFGSLMEHANSITNYLDKVLIISDCHNIDNVSKIETSFIKHGVDIELDHNIKTLMDSQDQLEACRSYFSSLVAKYETSGKINKTRKTKNSKLTLSKDQAEQNQNKDEDEDNEEDTKMYVKIYETERNNFSLLATDRRCKILDELIKNKTNNPNKQDKNVTLKYYSRYSNEETTFTLNLELEYEKQSTTNKYITNEQIKRLCKNVSLIKTQLINIVSKVYQHIVLELQDYQPNIDIISEFITYTDVIYSKAYIATKYNYCKPEIIETESGKSFVSSTDLRHCLIEKLQQSELYIGNNINIGDYSVSNPDISLDGILLYGTNAVGKTSFIRALGISLIMAQAGLYVPASTYKYKPYKYIFTRILGNDNIFKGLSTFAVEMSELRTILRLADKNSLVLGDELCSGTESISAVSIFVSGVQKLASIHCSFIFATHLHEIINYDEITTLHNVGMKHMSVMYDVKNDCLVYNRKLQDGPGNNMYGLEVCKSLNLPQDFLENAHNIRLKYHPESTRILDYTQSHFNTKHIVGGLCEKCKTHLAVDVHHLVFQNEADSKGRIKKSGLSFQKNEQANLINLCEKCHNEIHKSHKKYKKTKTTKGIILEEVL